MDAVRRVQQETIDLRRIDASRQEREGYRRVVATFPDERAVFDLLIEVDALPIEPWRCACLQSAPFEATRLE
jgi:hypothetical protein